MTDEERNSKARAAYHKNRDHRRALAQKHREEKRAADPQAWAEYNRQQMANWRARHSEKYLAYYRDYSLKSKYGITFGQLNAMLAAQGFKCAICQGTIDEVTRRVDHDHETKQVRGLLCHNCNVTLGHCKESSEVLRAAATYLETHALKRAKVG